MEGFRICDFLLLDTVHIAPPGSPDHIVVTFKRFLERGGRPRALVLRLSGRRSAEDRTRIGLGVLAELVSFEITKPLQSLQLQGVPLSPELCATIAAAAPRPTCLKLRGYDMSGGGGAAAGGADTTGAVAQLLRAAAPGLQRLSLEGLRTAPGWAPHVLTALQQCTALRSLTLRIAFRPGNGFPFKDAVPLLESLAALPGLDTLKLRVNADNGHVLPHVQRSSGTRALAAPLCALSRLTRLVFEWDVPTVVLPALPHLLALAALELPESTLPAANLRQLAATAPALTHLCVQYIPPWVLDGRKPLRFPPGLRSLELRTESADPYMLLALRLPASYTRLLVQGLQVDINDNGDDDDDDDVESSHFSAGVLKASQDAAAELLSALALLEGRGFDGDRLRGPFRLSGVNLSAEEAVPGGFAALMSALARLRLRALAVRTKWMNPCFVELLVRGLPDLEVGLDLELCLVEPSTLQHLQHLPRLHALKLGFSSVSRDSGEQLAQQLLGVIDSATSLRRLELGIHGRPRSSTPVDDSIQHAQELVKAELQRRGRDLDFVQVEF